MPHRARMFKTLGWLAASMTGATALLGWVNPMPLDAHAPLPPDQIAGMAQAQVAKAAHVTPDRWRHIEITAGRTYDTADTLLAAASAGGDAHFIIDVEGRPQCAPLWRKQQPTVGADRTVRIKVRRRRSGGPMSAAQWLCVQSLILSLDEWIAPPSGSLPVRLHAVWSQVYGLEDGSVLALAAGHRP